MRLTISLLALASIVVAGVVPRSGILDESSTVTSAAANLHVARAPVYLCKCPKDLFGDVGVHIYEDNSSYQCAYPQGACQWLKVCVLSLS
jgi:hypothetical protein